MKFEEVIIFFYILFKNTLNFATGLDVAFVFI